MTSHSTEYKLRCSLIGHTMDVRAVTTLENNIISASRDQSTKLWSQDLVNSRVYVETTTYKGHTGYISCVCAIPGDNSTTGFYATGSRDCSIRVYPHSCSEATHILTGHTDTVSCLTFHDGMLISGSWDCSVKVWKNWECTLTMSGHSGPVWSVAVVTNANLSEASIITASADKTLKCWKNGKEVLTYEGHTDCVRGVAVWGTDKFLSCSNDASVRLWKLTGECLATYYGHTNYIYCIATLPDYQGFVTSGEDRTIRAWDLDGNLIQTIYLPAQSIWSIAALPNSDIVAGSSNGTCSLFTRSIERAADEEELKLFEEKLSQFKVAAEDIGGIKKSEIPDKSILLTPGKKDGQTIMVRDKEKIFCYNWSSSKQSWEAVGEVVGGAGGSASTSGKILYLGREYDYVFDVDIDEGRTLKLPYNNGDDPYMEAQSFIHLHELPQDYLDQVANFIIKNANVTSQSIRQNDTYFDPFTGGSRYVPSVSASSGTGISGQTDPFTGSGRYVPSESTSGATGSSMETDPFTGAGRYIPQSSTSSTPEKRVSPYFPQVIPLKFDNINKMGILNKLKDANNFVSEKLTNEQIVAMLETAISPNPNVSILAPLEAALHWPSDKVWPAIDVLRLAVRSATVQETWLKGQNGSDLVKFLVGLLDHNTSATNQLLSLRCLTNIASHPPGRKALESAAHSVISASSSLVPYLNNSYEIAAATLSINYSIILRDSKVLENQCLLLSNAITIAVSSRDSEAIFRSLVAMGTLLSVGGGVKYLATSLDLKPVLENLAKTSNPPKVGECAKHILSII